MQWWNATGNGNLDENGLHMLLISRAGRDKWIGEVTVVQGIHELKSCVIYIIMIPLVNLWITCVHSTNAVIVLFKVSCYTGSTDCTYCKCINLSIALCISCTLYMLMTINIIRLK